MLADLRKSQQLSKEFVIHNKFIAANLGWNWNRELSNGRNNCSFMHLIKLIKEKLGQKKTRPSFKSFQGLQKCTIARIKIYWVTKIENVADIFTASVYQLGT